MKQNIHFFIFLNIALLALLSNFLAFVTNIEYAYRLLIIAIFQIVLNFIMIRRKIINLETNFEKKDLIFFSILFIIFINTIFLPDTAYDTNNYHVYLQQENATEDLSFNLLPAKVLNNYLFPLGDKMHYIFRYFLGYRLGTLLSYYVIIVMFYQLKNILNLILKNNNYISYLSIGILSSYVLYLFISSYYIDSLGTAFILEILYILLRNKNIFNTPKLLLYLSLLSGFSIAIKLPNIFMIVPIILFFLLKHRKEVKVNYFSIYILCLIVILIPVIPYCLNNFIQTGSPLFPYYNNIIKSEYFSETYFKDSRFGIPNILYALIWPIYTSIIHLGYGDNWMIRDFIWAIGYTFSLLTLIFSFILKKTKYEPSKELKNMSIIAITLTIVWIVFLYGYMRYALIIPIIYYIVISMIINEFIYSNNKTLKVLLGVISIILLIGFIICKYYIIAALILGFIIYSAINILYKNTKKLDTYFICIIILFALVYAYNLLVEVLNNPIQKNDILNTFVDRSTLTIEIDGVWGVIADDSSITELVRNSSTPIYNLDKSNYTSERALEVYKEKVINSDKDIYVLIDSKKSKYKLYALEQNGFEIAEIVAKYDVNTLHFLEASNIVQLVKVKYVGI